MIIIATRTKTYVENVLTTLTNTVMYVCTYCFPLFSAFLILETLDTYLEISETPGGGNMIDWKETGNT